MPFLSINGMAGRFLALGLTLFIFQTHATVRGTALATFDGTNGASAQCYGDALTLGVDGNFYGTTSGGGEYGKGTVFRITRGGNLTTLHSFNGTNDGQLPLGGLTALPDGFLYGTAQSGGANTNGAFYNGTFFKVSTNGEFTLLSHFATETGANPTGALIQGNDGHLYGTTFRGGANNLGTVFRVNTNGDFAVVASFSGTNGANPTGPLLQTADGEFYGTTAYGGIGFGVVGGGSGSGYGTVFRIATNGVLTNLVLFNGTNGSNPYSGLIKAGDGHFYGTSAYGGTGFVAGQIKSGHGTIFRIETDTLTHVPILFPDANTGRSYFGLLQATDGNLYGVKGGPVSSGEVFRLSENNEYRSMFRFSSASYVTNGITRYLLGLNPYARLIQTADGYIWGTTGANGMLPNGSNGQGTVFRLTFPPQLQAIGKTNDTTYFSWSGFTGFRYQIQGSTNLAEQSWQNIGDSFIGTNGLNHVSEATEGIAQKFYRILILE